MSKNKKILFSGIFLAAVVAVLVFMPTKTSAFWDEAMNPISTALYVVFLAVSQMLKIAGLLFDYAVNPKNFTDVLKTQAVYNGWKMVRDLFNLAFILVLLFSAFSTIFQVEKFHIKKILLTLVIIALLVNFSYPIALFIIDSSNVVMYYLLNAAFPDSEGTSMISTGWAKWSGVTNSLIPQDDGKLDYSSTNLKMKLVMAIVFVFVLMATMITMAILLVIRIVVLAILIILAPAGFVAGILPSTKKYSDDWWSNLFKYSFMGPTLAFMIVLGLKMMAEMKTSESMESIAKMAANNSGQKANESYLASLTFFAIPIVIMWSGMIVAQKLGVAGTGFAVKMGQGAAKKFSGFNAVKKRYDAFSAERKKRADEKFKGNLGTKLGKLANVTQDTVHGSLRRGDKWYAGIPGSKGARKRIKTMREEENKKRIKEGADGLIDEGQSTASLAASMNTSFDKPAKTKEDKIAQAKNAAAYQRMDRDDKKQHILEEIGSGRDTYKHILSDPNIPSHLVNAQIKAQEAAAYIATGSKDEEHLRAVSSFINEQAKRMVNIGATAQGQGVAETAKKAAAKVKSFRSKTP